MADNDEEKMVAQWGDYFEKNLKGFRDSHGEILNKIANDKTGDDCSKTPNACGN